MKLRIRCPYCLKKVRARSHELNRCGHCQQQFHVTYTDRVPHLSYSRANSPGVFGVFTATAYKVEETCCAACGVAYPKAFGEVCPGRVILALQEFFLFPNKKTEDDLKQAKAFLLENMENVKYCVQLIESSSSDWHVIWKDKLHLIREFCEQN